MPPAHSAPVLNLRKDANLGDFGRFSGLVGPFTAFPRPLPLPMLRMRVACGFPSPAEDFLGEDLDLSNLCIRNPPATFFAQAEGDSMKGFGIEHGDMLVVDRSIEAKDRDIVLVLWEGGLTVKQLCSRHGTIELRSGNGTAPLALGEGCELQIWGVITWSFKKQFRRG